MNALRTLLANVPVWLGRAAITVLLLSVLTTGCIIVWWAARRPAQVTISMPKVTTSRVADLENEIKQQEFELAKSKQRLSELHHQRNVAAVQAGIDKGTQLSDDLLRKIQEMIDKTTTPVIPPATVKTEVVPSGNGHPLDSPPTIIARRPGR